MQYLTTIRIKILVQYISSRNIHLPLYSYSSNCCMLLEILIPMFSFAWLTIPFGDGIFFFSFPLSTVGEPVPLPKPRKAAPRPVVPKRKLAPSSPSSKTLSSGSDQVERLLNAGINSSIDAPSNDTSSEIVQSSTKLEEKVETVSNCSTSESEVFLTPGIDQSQATFDYSSVTLKENEVESLTTVQTDNKEEKEVSSSTEKNIENPSTSRGSSNQEKKLCAVISTIPKCEVLNTLNVDNTKAQNKEKEGLKDPKRTRIPRTASKSNDFETNSLERQRRHLTSQLEDITFALNLNVASNVGLSSDRSEKFQGNAQQLEEKENDCSQGVGGGKSHPEMSASGACCISLMRVVMGT